MNKSTKSKLNKKLIKKLIKYYALLFIKSELIRATQIILNIDAHKIRVLKMK